MNMKNTWLEKLKKRWDILLLLLVFIFVVIQLAPTQQIEFRDWRYSTQKFPNFFALDFDDKDWNDINQLTGNESFAQDIYLRGGIILPDSTNIAKVRISANDCIAQMYVNGVEVFSDLNCSECKHCNGMEFDLSSYVVPGENLIAIRILNIKGNAGFQISNVEKNISPLLTLIMLTICSIILLKRRNIESNSTALLIFVLISIAFLSPVLTNFDYYGINDWNAWSFRYETQRKTILDYHQIPLWNPYPHGGNTLIGHPAMPFFSPAFILTLLFGTIYGLKVSLFFYLIIGLFGSFLLSKHLGLLGYSSYLPAFIYMLSSVYSLHLTEGHVEWLAMAWLPWVFLYYLKAIKNRKYFIVSTFFLSLIYIQAHIYLLAYTVLFLILYSTFESLRQRKLRPLGIVCSILILFALICSVKLLPVMEFTSQYPRLMEDQSGFNIELLYNSLLNIKQGIWWTHHFDGQKWGWHEYGAYIGEIPLLLSLFGIVISIRKKWTLALTAFIFLALSLTNNFPVNLWEILHNFPIYNALRNPSRLILMIVFFLSIFSGIALHRFEKEEKNKLLAGGITLFVLFNLVIVNSPTFEIAFSNPPIETVKGVFYHTSSDEDVPYTELYKNLLENHGTMKFYDSSPFIPPMAIPRVVNGTINPEYRGEVYLQEGKGTAKITHFSPNKIEVNVNAVGDDLLILNQNFYKGWRVKGKDVKSNEGLVSVSVTPQDKHITFYYLPTSFLIGALITALSLIFSVIFYIKFP